MRTNKTGHATISYKSSCRGFLLQFIFAVLACAGSIGCQGEGSPGPILFSPDGSIVAHTYVKRIDLPIPPEVPTLYSTVYLQWYHADQLKIPQSIKIDSYGKSYGSFVQGQFRLLYSPDSRHIAVKSPRYLEVVDLETKKRHRLTGPDELVSSMGWLGNTEMVYVIYRESETKKHSYGRIRQIYRHPIADLPEKRQLLYEQNDYRGNYHDYVSPTGEYVVFMSQGYSDGLFYLLNIQTMKVTPLNDKTAKCQGVSWKPDGSSVFLLSGKEALLHYPKEGRTKDISDDYDNTFCLHLEYAPSIDNLWTPDSEYIVINSSKTGGCLVRPDPWRVVPIGKRLVKYLEDVKHRRIYRNPLSPDSYPYLFVQSYPGWVRLWIQLVTDKKPYLPGQTVVLEAQNYLVDYEGKQILSMKPSDSPGGAWALTPDGKKMVYFNRSIFLDEKPVSLPENTE